LWVVFALLALAPAANAQAFPDAATQRERVAALREAKDLEALRALLAPGNALLVRVEAIDALAQAAEPADVPRLLGLIDDLEPAISGAAMAGLRRFGRAGLTALANTKLEGVSAVALARARNELLTGHIHACCRRDLQLNPLGLDYAGRFAELYSTPVNPDELMLTLLRGAMASMRKDVAGTYGNRRFMWNGEVSIWTGDLTLEVGALVVSALAVSHREALLRELDGIEEHRPQGYYWGSQARQPATRAAAVFLAASGRPQLSQVLVRDLEVSTTWNTQGEAIAATQLEIARLQLAEGLRDQAWARLEAIVERSQATGGYACAWAAYLLARLHAQSADVTSALRMIELACEVNSEPPLLILVDDALDSLRKDSRFETVTRYCELAARRASESRRPWRREP
jgi:hypothetical protein